jgi:hypothetical protein
MKIAFESRDVLFFFMGIIAVCLVVSFSACELTTYGSIRDTLGGIAAQPSQIVNLHTQYNDMVDQFSNGRGDLFTYHYGGQDIVVSVSQVVGKSESQVMGIVLDKYSQNFYSGNVYGDYATVSSFVGSGANAFYLLLTLLLFASFLAILILAYVQKWYESTMDMLKSSGKIILIVGVIAFIIFLFMPSVVKSVMWGSISSDLGRDITYVLEPRITGTFLVNMLIVILFGALLYGAGFLIHINTGEGEPDPVGYMRSAPKLRSLDGDAGTGGGPAGRGPPPGKPGRRQL